MTSQRNETIRGPQTGQRNVDNSSLGLGPKIRKFLTKSNSEKLESVRFRLRTVFPKRPVPMLLPFGATWLLENSALDAELRGGWFEHAETRFVERFLRPGMLVFDIGAHHGFYALLASLRVGSQGRVIAFEPSSRERKRLCRHIRLNRCKNVYVESVALGNWTGKSDFFLVDGRSDYCNSLRPPSIEEPTKVVQVNITSLDEYLSRSGIVEVDFIKIDVEGAELDVLRGASNILSGRARQRRPVLLIEIYEIRTRPWGYPAREIVNWIGEAGYLLYRVFQNGDLSAVDPVHDGLDANFVAVPSERRTDVCGFLSDQETENAHR